MKTIACSTLSLMLLATCALQAQEPKFPPPEKAHEWLQQMVGEWDAEMEAMAAPGQPAMKCKGTIQARSLGGYWVVSEMKADMMGKPMIGIQSIGYDPKTKKYVGTWVDSMSAHIWKYEGTLDESGKILTLEAEGPNFMLEGKMAKFRDVYEIKSKDEIKTSSGMQGDDGKWITFMNGISKRKK